MPNSVLKLSVFPIKSIGGVFSKTLDVLPEGPKGDRRFMLIDQKGAFITARKYPALLLIRSNAEDKGFRLSFPGEESIFLPFQIDNGDFEPVTIWRDHFEARQAGEKYSNWFSSILDIECRLVFMDKKTKRVARGSFDQEHFVSFADNAPILLLSQASLEDLNRRLKEPVTAEHFRPNILFSGQTPYEENNWESIQIGKLIFKNAVPCSRCILTTIDPVTAEKSSKGEPLKTLANYRKTSEGVVFGQYIYPVSSGIIHQNDPITPLTFRNLESPIEK